MSVTSNQLLDKVKADIAEVTVAQVQADLQAGKSVHLVDVREPDEVVAGSPLGAQHRPWPARNRAKTFPRQILRFRGRIFPSSGLISAIVVEIRPFRHPKMHESVQKRPKIFPKSAFILPASKRCKGSAAVVARRASSIIRLSSYYLIIL